MHPISRSYLMCGHDIVNDSLENFHNKIYCMDVTGDCIRGKCNQCGTLDVFKSNIEFNAVINSEILNDEIFGFELWERSPTDNAWITKGWFFYKKIWHFLC